MILCELLYKLVLFCNIVRVGKNSYCEFDKLNYGKESTSEEGRCFVLYEELKSIENLIEGNEYFDGGVSYCVGIDKIDGAVSLDFAIKKCLLEMEAIVSSEMKIVITPIKYPRDEIKKLVYGMASK